MAVSSLTEHIKKLKTEKGTPHDVFHLALRAANSELDEPDYEVQKHIMKMTAIIDMYIQQARITNDRMLSILMRQAESLVHLLDLARRNHNYVLPFRIEYHKFRSKMLMTRASGGKLSDQLSSAGRYTAQGGGVIYGEQMPTAQDLEEEDSLMDKIFNRKKKKQGVMQNG